MLFPAPNAHAGCCVAQQRTAGRPSGARQPAATHPHPSESPRTLKQANRDRLGAATSSSRRRPLLSDVRPGQQQPWRRRRGSCCNSSTIGAWRGPLRVERRRSAARPPERPCKPSVHPSWLQDEGDPRRWAPSSGEVRHHALLPAPSRLRPLHCAPGHVRSAMGRRTRPRPSGLLPRHRRRPAAGRLVLLARAVLPGLPARL